MASPTEHPSEIPAYAADLETVYGGPSRNAFGSAVFFVPSAEQAGALEQQALDRYKHFAGETWERFGEQNWLAAWSRVHERSAGAPRDIVSELKSLPDREARQSAELLLGNAEQTAGGLDTLKRAFDDEAVSELNVYRIGDGGAMSGVLIASRRADASSLFLLLLLD